MMTSPYLSRPARPYAAAASTPMAYAMTCARANPSKVNAILCLRNLVADGVAVDAALSAVFGAFPLGLNEIHDISAEARRRFGEAA